MTVVGKSWNRLTLPGKVIFTVVPLQLVTTTRWSSGSDPRRARARPAVEELPIVRSLVGGHDRLDDRSDRLPHHLRR
jgi:hypothetical protein